MNDHGINHCDARGMYTSPLLLVPSFISLTDYLHLITGITQKISDLQSSYNPAHDWKQNMGAGILDSNTVNGVKTVNGMSAFHPVAHRFMNPILCLDRIHALCQYWYILDPIMG
ncbi:hypothetical protein VP01_5975g2 [Puccinia sorghi]|uniref:Uncharacterized protein n=1 Tax=Puccinia sorghi TaxID=27349 RepID=A0A0L6UHM0_9BASI|nr:hypothetical protein VP01_5975g2 [Puccinia sorghi]